MTNYYKSIKFTLLFIFLFCTVIFSRAQTIKPGLVLTFDDYSVANWYKLLPIFEKYQAKATFYVCCPYLLDSTKQQKLKKIYNAGNEIGSHGYHHYNSVNYIDTATMESFIKNEIESSIHWFDSVLTIKPTCFSYPYGSLSSQLNNELSNYFITLRGTNYSINSSTNKISNLSNSKLIYGVGIDVDYGFTLSQIKAQILTCKTDSLIQVFYSHTPVDSNASGYQTTYAQIDSILNYAYHLGLSFYTASQVWLPIPDKPVGDTIIMVNSTLSSTYYTSTINYKYNWKLIPDGAGYLTYLNNEATIVWNKNYVGKCKLMVASSDTCGTGNYSSLTINIKDNTSLLSEQQNNLMVYPNPSSGQFNINLQSYNSSFKIELINTMGQIVYHEQITNNQTIKYYNKGLYILKIIQGENIINKKIIIQ